MALLRKALVCELNWPRVSALQAHIHHHASGAPYLYTKETARELLHISISHSGKWVGFALSPLGQPVGFDLEVISKKRDVLGLSQYAFSDEEQVYVSQNGALAFYYLWGAKEALAKFFGEGLSFALGLDLGGQLGVPKKENESIVFIKGERFLIQHTLAACRIDF